MKRVKEAQLIHETGKNVTELITRGANGVPYCTYQKRILGAEAGG